MQRFVCLLSVLFFLSSVELFSQSATSVAWESLLPRISTVPPRVQNEIWASYLGFPNGVFKSVKTRMSLSLTASGYQTIAEEDDSRITLTFLPDGEMKTMKTEFLSTDLASWNQADLLLAEYQSENHNLAFQRALNDQVQDARNMEWGPGWMDFSALPSSLERLVRSGFRGTVTFQNYIRNAPCRLQIEITETDRPLEKESRYLYPRWFRENLAHKKVVLAQMRSAPDSKGAYPYPFFYAFEPTSSGLELIATWGGQLKEPLFQYRENLVVGK